MASTVKIQLDPLAPMESDLRQLGWRLLLLGATFLGQGDLVNQIFDQVTDEEARNLEEMMRDFSVQLDELLTLMKQRQQEADADGHV